MAASKRSAAAAPAPRWAGWRCPARSRSAQVRRQRRRQQLVVVDQQDAVHGGHSRMRRSRSQRRLRAPAAAAALGHELAHLGLLLGLQAVVEVGHRGDLAGLLARMAPVLASTSAWARGRSARRRPATAARRAGWRCCRPARCAARASCRRARRAWPSAPRRAPVPCRLARSCARATWPRLRR